MKRFAILAAIMLAAPAWAQSPTAKKLLREQAELQPKLSECMQAEARAMRNGNVWQEDHLTMDECKARAMEAIDLGQRLLQESLKSDIPNDPDD